MDIKKAVRCLLLTLLDQKLTNSNPYSTLNLGYDSESKVRRIAPSRRKLRYQDFDAATTSE